MKSKKELKFVHITKCAGTSVEKSAQDQGIHWGACDAWYKNNIGHYHFPLSELDDSKLEEIRDKFDLFTIIRDPADRCVSEFHCKWGNMDKSLDWKYMSKARFNIELFGLLLKRTPLKAASRLINSKRFLKIQASAPWHWIPQSSYTHKKNGKQIIKHLIPFNNLSLSLNELFDRYNIQIDISQHNVSDKRFSREDVYRINRLLIYIVYWKDYKYLNYLF